MGIFVNQKTEQDLNNKGVSRVDFCSEPLIDAVKDEFVRLHPNLDETMKSGYYFSVFGESIEYRKSILEKILPLLKDSIDAIFTDYKVLAVIAQIKGVGPDSAVTVHQDLTMVDESKYSSYSLWIPLQDSTVENGPLSFLEYSQRAFRGGRSHMMDYLFENVEDFVFENSTEYLADKGQALIFDNATIHHSSLNKTNSPRFSIAVSIVSKDAEIQLLHYERDKPFDGTLDRYSVPDDFWYRYKDFAKERLLPPIFGTKVGVKDDVQVLPFDRSAFIKKYELTKQALQRGAFCEKVVPVLKDEHLQNQLNHDGIILLDFLSPEDVERLNLLFHELHITKSDIPNDKLYTCQHNPDSEYRDKMNQEIGELINPMIEKVFKDVKTTAFTFQIKGIGPNTELGVHQDWSFAREEDGFRTYTLWISLINSDATNGTLSVLKGSHVPADGIRGAGIEPHFEGLQSEILPLLEPLKIKAGQLVLFDSSLIHYSAANNSGSIRVSAMTNIIPSKADTYLYFGSSDDGLIAEYLVPDDFFLHYTDFKSEYEKPPRFAQKKRVLKPTLKKISIEELRSLSSNETNGKEIAVTAKYSEDEIL